MFCQNMTATAYVHTAVDHCHNNKFHHHKYYKQLHNLTITSTAALCSNSVQSNNPQVTTNHIFHHPPLFQSHSRLKTQPVTQINSITDC